MARQIVEIEIEKTDVVLKPGFLAALRERIQHTIRAIEGQHIAILADRSGQRNGLLVRIAANIQNTLARTCSQLSQNPGIQIVTLVFQTGHSGVFERGNIAVELLGHLPPSPRSSE